MIIDVIKWGLTVVFVLFLASACSNEGGPVTADRPTSTSAATQQRLQEVEAKVKLLESRLRSTREHLFIAALIGAVLLVGVGLLLWKRGSNRRRQITKIKKYLKKIERQKERGQSWPAQGVQRSRSGKQQQAESEITSELEQRVAKLENEIERLRKVKEIATRQTEKSESDVKQEAEGSSTAKERSESTSFTAAPGEGSSIEETESPESRPDSAVDLPPTPDSAEKQKTGKQEPRPKEDHHSGARGLGSSQVQKSGSESEAIKEGATGKRNPEESTVDDFNRFLHDRLSKDDFEKRYNPTRLGIGNEEERLDKADAPVILQKDDRGQYLAVEQEDYYLVLPKYDLVLDESVRRQAGFDAVFQCDETPHEHPYRIHRLDRAAKFVHERQEKFVLEAPGNAALKRYG